MANYPKKLMDPTEAALSAIQEALNIRDDEERQPAPPDEQPRFHWRPPSDAMPHTEPAMPAFDEAIDLDDIDTRDHRTAEPQPFRAANDDQQSIGRILRALQDRPARTSYFVAAMFSAAWVVGCLALSWAYLADFNAALGPGHSPAAAMIGLGAAALLPIIFFFGIAHMAWRSQELRLITQSMAQVAMRLAEPESVARDSIVTVGQAIRREVAAMGDGVERALARAGELETLVQNEVAALERTYSDNEVRIRGLLQDLANQRDTLVGQAEQVRSAINNVHIDLTQDLSTISDLVGQQVNEAAQRITHSLAEKGEHITLALGQVSDNMIQQLDRARRRSPGAAGKRQRGNLARDFDGERSAHLQFELQDRPCRRGFRRDRVRARRHDDGSARARHRRLLREIAGDRRPDDGPLARGRRPRCRPRPGTERRHHRYVEPAWPRRSRRAPTRSTRRSRPPASRSSSISACAAATSPKNSKRPASASPRR